LDCDDIGDLHHILIEGNTFICKALNKLGIRFFRASFNSLVQAHNNSFSMRHQSQDPASLTEYCIKNVVSAGYNPDALVFTKTGTATITLLDESTATGTTTYDTNTYMRIPS